MPVLAGDTIAVWFSCGAASAVAAQATIRLYGKDCTVRIINNPVIEEGDDNRRFLADAAAWLGQPIELATHAKYPGCSAAEVWSRRSRMNSMNGAPCTVHLKKEARQQWESRNPHQWLVMGFCADEKRRADRFRLTERANLLTPLIDLGVTHDETLRIVERAGLVLPLAYRKGYNNANCIGCVKATSPTYWNHVRAVDPDVFAARAVQSRALGAKLARVKGTRIFLDELDPDAKGRPMKALRSADCGLFCEERA